MAANTAQITVQVDIGSALTQLKSLQTAFSNLQNSINNSLGSGKLPTALNTTAKSMKQVNNEAKSLASSFGLLYSAIAAIGIMNFAQSLGSLILQTDRLNRVLEGSVSGFEDFATSLSYVRSNADSFGARVDNLTRGYSQLVSATKESTVTLEETKIIFEGITSAITALQLSSDDARGAMTAIVQIMSKGKVQAEELRGQLGERIPGAFQIAAKAMNMTTKELDKFLKDGKLTSDEFLPKFGKAMKEHFGDAAVKASGSATSAMNRFFNEIFYLGERIGQEGGFVNLSKLFDNLGEALRTSSASKDFVVMFSNILEIMNNILPVLQGFIDGVFAVLTPILSLITAITGLSPAFKEVAFGVGVLVASMLLFNTVTYSLMKMIPAITNLVWSASSSFLELSMNIASLSFNSKSSNALIQSLDGSIFNVVETVEKLTVLQSIRLLFEKFKFAIADINIGLTALKTTILISLLPATELIKSAMIFAFSTHPIIGLIAIFALLGIALAAHLVDLENIQEAWKKLIEYKERYLKAGESLPLLNEEQTKRHISLLDEYKQRRQEMLDVAKKRMPVDRPDMSIEERATEIYQQQYREINRLIEREEALLRINKRLADPKELHRFMPTPTLDTQLDNKTKQIMLKLQADIYEAYDKGREAELLRQQTSYLKEYEELEKSDEAIRKLVEWNQARKYDINKKWDEKEAREKRTAYDLFLDMYSTHLKEMGDIAGADLEELKNKYQKLKTTIETDPYLNKNPELKKDFLILLGSNEIKETETTTQKFTLLFQEMWAAIKKQAEDARRSLQDLLITLKELKNEILTTIENKPITLDLLGTHALERIQETRKLSFEYEKSIIELNRKIYDVTQQGYDDRLKLEQDYNNRATTGVTEQMYNERLDLINKKETEETEIIKQQVAARAELYKLQSESIMSKEMKDYLTSSIEYLSDTFADAFVEMSNGTKSVSKAFKDMAISIANDLQKLLFKQAFLMIFQTIANAYTGGGTTSTGMTTNSFAGGFSGKAGGGLVNAGGAYLIGEKGPELLQMGNRSGSITPNNKLGASENNFNISVNVDGSKGGTPEQNDKLGRTIAREVKDQVKKIILEEKRYGGSLGRTAMRTI